MKMHEHRTRNLDRITKGMKGHEDSAGAHATDQRTGDSDASAMDHWGMRKAGVSSGASLRVGGVVHEAGVKKRLDRLTRATGGGIPDPVTDNALREKIEAGSELSKGGRAKRANGGPVGGKKAKGKNIININIGTPDKSGGATAMPPVPPPPMPPGPPPGMPPMPPPGMGGLPPGMPPPGMGGPPGMPPGLPPRPPMGAPPMMGRASGGRVEMDDSADSGEGRLEKSRMAAKKLPKR